MNVAKADSLTLLEGEDRPRTYQLFGDPSAGMFGEVVQE